MEHDDPSTGGVSPPRSLEQRARDLAASASHEMRTPVTIMLGSLDTLHRLWPRLTDEQRLILVDQAIGGASRLACSTEAILREAGFETGVLAPVGEATSTEQETA